MNHRNLEHLEQYQIEKEIQKKFRESIFRGLMARPRKLDPRFFYDSIGMETLYRLYEEMDYYLYQSEISILKQTQNEIQNQFGESQVFVEPFCGPYSRSSHLVNLIRPLIYIPHSESCEVVREIASEVIRAEKVHVHPLSTPFEKLENALDGIYDGEQRLLFLPGNQIGNHTPEEAVLLLKTLRRVVGVDGMILAGVDQNRDPLLLSRAYDDPMGVTAAFNLNMIFRIRREPVSDIDPGAFEHTIHFNEKEGCMEMHLCAIRPHSFQIEGAHFHIPAGESIHTESSYKYDLNQFSDLASRAGFQSIDAWTDPEGLYALHLLRYPFKFQLSWFETWELNP